MPEETQIEQLEKRRAIIPAGPRGIELKSLNDFYRFAEYVVAAGVAPKGLDGAAGVLIALQHGAEVGLLPMQALQSIYIVNGQPHLFSDAPKGIVLASGLLEKCKEFFEGKYPEDSFRAVVEIKRVGYDQKRVEFSIEDAKRAGLWQNKSKDPWIHYPKRMLRWRALGYALRDEFPDVLKGFPIRELLDEEDEALARAKPVKEAPPIFTSSQVESGQVESGQAPSSQVKSKPEKKAAAKATEANHEPTHGVKGEATEADPSAGSPNVFDQVRNRLDEMKKSERDFLVLLRDHDFVTTEVALEDVSEYKLRQLLEHWDHVERAFKGELL